MPKPRPARRPLPGSTANLAGAAAQSVFPIGVFAATAESEVTKGVLDFIALTDATPLINKYGLPEIAVRGELCGTISSRDLSHDRPHPAGLIARQRIAEPLIK